MKTTNVMALVAALAVVAGWATAAFSLGEKQAPAEGLWDNPQQSQPECKYNEC